MTRTEADAWAARILKNQPSHGTSEVNATRPMARRITRTLQANGYDCDLVTRYPGRQCIQYARRKE